MAARLRDVRRRHGDPEREVFAARLGVAASTLAGWERGETIPDAKSVALYRERVGVDLDWLLLGEGVPPAAGLGAPLDTGIMRRLGEIVDRAHTQAGIKLPKGAEFETAAELYNEFAGLCPNVEQTASDVVDAMLEVIEARLKGRLATARSAPGTGKRLA